MSSRMLRIETRRSLAFWIVPILAIAAGLEANSSLLPREILLWPDISATVRDLVVFLGPFVGGMAAWIAGRDRRRGVEELITTTPRPAVSRNLHTWAATLLWGVLAFVVAGSALVVYGYVNGAWGQPVMPVMLLGLLVIPAYAALGYATGLYLPSRFTAPLVAVALFGVQVYLAGRQSPSAFLLPTLNPDGSIWYTVRASLGLSQSLFLLGLTGVALAAVALKAQRSFISWALLGAGLVVMVTGAGTVLATAPEGGNMLLTEQLTLRAEYRPTPYEPVCAGAPIPVCLHPAFKQWLLEIAGAVNRVAAPLAGIPGVPTRAEQGPGAYVLPSRDGALTVRLSGYEWDLEALPYSVAGALTTDLQEMETSSEQVETSWQAQQSIQVWLLKGAGVRVECADMRTLSRYESGTFDIAVCRAAGRFEALGAAKQREWLAKNYTALRSGKIGLEDLP